MFGTQTLYGPFPQTLQDLFLLGLSEGLSPDPAPAEAQDVLSFADFIRKVNPRYVFYDHAEALIAVLQRVADGEIKDLMVFMPPRHGKSEHVSRLFPAYLLHTQPERWVAISSYAADLAYSFSRNARDNYRLAGGETKGDAAAVRHWETGKGGGLWATGVGGPATGKGFHYGIIDDPVKNAEEASSMAIRAKHWDWWNSTWLTRQEPGAARIVVQTRWHEDDLSGRILEQIKEEPEPWHIVNMPAIREDTPRAFPACCTVIEDRRDAGEPLCAERYDLEALGKFERRDPYHWSALFQQNPSPTTGALWQRLWFAEAGFHDAPPLGAVGYDWDTAYTKNDNNSATAYVKSGVAADGTIYVLDIGWRWVETPAAEQWMRELGGPHFIEAKASGKGLAQRLRLASIAVVEVAVSGDKVLRTRDAMPEVQAGRVRFAAHLLPLLLDDEKQGILKFPHGSHDDLNDALVQAIKRHRTPRKTIRHTRR